MNQNPWTTPKTANANATPTDTQNKTADPEPSTFNYGTLMKTTIATTAFVLVASLALAACSNGQHPAGDQNSINDQPPAQVSPDNPGAMDSNQPVSDTWITTKVKSELATTDGVESSDISVKTVNGVVTLTGVLASDIATKKAVAAAKSVKGVTQVDSSGLKSGG